MKVIFKTIAEQKFVSENVFGRVEDGLAGYETLSWKRQTTRT
jgi:hypothetical protein